jgi:hypothetical protein
MVSVAVTVKHQQFPPFTFLSGRAAQAWTATRADRCTLAAAHQSVVSTHAHGTFAGCGQRHHRVRVHAPTATLPASRLSVLTQPVSAAKPVCLSGCHQHHPATTHTYHIPHLPSHVAMPRELTGALWLQPTKHAEALAALIAELSPCGLVAASTRCFQPPPTLPGLLVSITV